MHTWASYFLAFISTVANNSTLHPAQYISEELLDKHLHWKARARRCEFSNEGESKPLSYQFLFSHCNNSQKQYHNS